MTPLVLGFLGRGFDRAKPNPVFLSWSRVVTSFEAGADDEKLLAHSAGAMDFWKADPKAFCEVRAVFRVIGENMMIG